MSTKRKSQTQRSAKRSRTRWDSSESSIYAKPQPQLEVVQGKGNVHLFSCDRKQHCLFEYFRKYEMKPKHRTRAVAAAEPEIGANFSDNEDKEDKPPRTYFRVHVPGEGRCSHYDEYLIQQTGPNPNIFNSVYFLRKEGTYANALGEKLGGILGNRPALRLGDCVMLDTVFQNGDLKKQHERMLLGEVQRFDKWRDFIVEEIKT